MPINTSAFNDSSVLKKITYSIDDKPLGVEDIVTAEIHWNKKYFAVSGTILIKDNIDTANLLPLNSKNVLEVYAEDGFDEYYFKKFMIINVKEVRYKQRFKALEFEFVDRLTFTMMNTFIGKSYQNKKLSDIFKDYVNHYQWTDLIDSQVNFEILETTKVHPFITVPQDRNFLEWFKSELEKEGLTMYQTRKEVKICVKKDDLIPSNLEKIPHSYSQMHERADHPFRIHEHTTKFNPVLEQLKNVPIEAQQAFDFATKSMPKTQVDLKDVFDGIKTSTSKFNELQTTVGTKLSTLTNREVDKIKTKIQDAFLSNTELSIVVVGNFKYNNYYQNADVVLSGNLEHKQGQIEGDIAMSGVYTILSVVDRMVSSRIFQKITLVRVDFQENK